jgi:cell division protein FtsZ
LPIRSIVGGEDMRLMEVDEAANHIKELVDPDANIIWGSAFNTALDGKIRVSVVATGIEADASIMPEPARVFAFPAARKVEEPKAAPVVPVFAAPEPAPEPVVEAPAPVFVAEEPVIEEAVAEVAEIEAAPEALVETAEAEMEVLELEAPEAILEAEPEAEQEVETVNRYEDDAVLELQAPVAAEEPEELVLEAPAAEAESDPHPLRRSWLASQETEEAAAAERPAPRIASGGSTLFERMSNIARGAAKTDRADGNSDPLDIPRFLNRQNNQ